MKRKAVLGIMLTLLLMGMLTLVSNIQLVKASGTIYIRADGSVDPPTAPVSTVDNVTYTFTDNIYDEIVVEKDNIVVNGAGYTLQGTGTEGSTGIYIAETNNVTIKNMEISLFECGIHLVQTSKNIISGNNITGNSVYGIYLDSSSSNIISGNNITESDYGIDPYLSSNNTLSGNNVANNGYGVTLDCSINNTVSGNVMNGNIYNFGVWGNGLSHFMHSIEVSNLVDGKPVYYLVNQKDFLINPATHPQVGYLALINCTNVTVEALTLTNNIEGLLLAFTNNSRITDNNITKNEYGIWHLNSFDNTISGNNITNNGEDGIQLFESSNNNTVSENNITGNKKGIHLQPEYTGHASYNTVSGNNITGNNVGIYLDSSSNYNTVSQNNIANNAYGIYTYHSSNNIMSGNSITNNEYGISLESSDNTVSENNITDNIYGVWIYLSSNNKFYHNNFIGNTHQQVYIHVSLGYANFWDDGYPSGGNYWSDYSGSDLYSGPNRNQLGRDGIGDTSYVINIDNIDYYPLISPFPQTPDFDIVASPSTGTTAQGTTLTINAYVSTIAGYDYLVSLSASGQPEGVTISFNPNTGTPYFTSTMTIQVGDSVPPNIYLITITGLGLDGKTRSATYELTVAPTFPEFPSGIEAVTAIGLMAAIAFIWTRKRKTKAINTNASQFPFLYFCMKRTSFKQHALVSGSVSSCLFMV